MKQIFDLDKLVSITVKGKEEYWAYTYKKKSESLFGLVKTKEGFYGLMDEYVGTKEFVLSKSDKFFIEGDKLYYKPKVILRFVDGSETIKRFDTFSQANKYGHELSSKYFTSKLEIKE